MCTILSTTGTVEFDSIFASNALNSNLREDGSGNEHENEPTNQPIDRCVPTHSVEPACPPKPEGRGRKGVVESIWMRSGSGRTACARHGAPRPPKAARSAALQTLQTPGAGGFPNGAARGRGRHHGLRLPIEATNSSTPPPNRAPFPLVLDQVETDGFDSHFETLRPCPSVSTWSSTNVLSIPAGRSQPPLLRGSPPGRPNASGPRRFSVSQSGAVRNALPSRPRDALYPRG